MRQSIADELAAQPLLYRRRFVHHAVQPGLGRVFGALIEAQGFEQARARRCRAARLIWIAGKKLLDGDAFDGAQDEGYSGD